MKTIRFLLINLFVRDHNKTLEIIRTLDKNESPMKSVGVKRDYIGEFLLCDDFTEESLEESPKEPSVKKDKKQDLIDALNYLKSKSIKTKQDKESIYTLEILLKNYR